MPGPFSKRSVAVQQSGTLKLNDEVAKLRAQGEKIVSFTVGEPDFNTPGHIIEAATNAAKEGATKYTPSAGIPQLREAIAKKGRDENRIPCEPKHVLVTPSKQAIFMACQALLEEGDEVLVPDPAWVSYEACVRYAGAVPVSMRTCDEGGFRLTEEAVRRAVTKRTKLVVLNTPSNPTGCVASRRDLESIASVAREHDLYMLSDEVYEKLTYDGEHVSIASLPGMFERTVTINGFSKTYAMTGWRLGWAIAPEPIFQEILKYQQHSITCATSFAQFGGLAALTGPQEPVRRMIEEFRKRRDLIHKLVNETPGFSCGKPAGAFYVFPHYGQKLMSMQMAQMLLEKAKVAVTPGIEFGAAGERHLRFSYATSQADIERGLEAIRRALEKL